MSEKNAVINTRRSLSGKEILSKSVNLLGLIAMIIFFEVFTRATGKPTLITGDNCVDIFKQGFTMLVCALAAVFIMSTGNLDFSIGANLGFSCAICTLVCKDVSPVAGIAAAIVVGGIIGLVNGLVITKLKLPSFITCLCMMFILMAATQSICAARGGMSFNMPLKMRKWDIITIYSVIGVFYFILMLVMYKYTKFGKFMKAIGVSPEAARQSGVGVNKMIVLGYVLSGLAAGLAGFLTMLYVGGASHMTGSTMTTDVIIAVVFGGMSVAGGATSKISAAVLGTLIVSILNKGLILTGFGGDPQQLVKGIMFLIVIAISTDRSGNTIIK